MSAFDHNLHPATKRLIILSLLIAFLLDLIPLPAAEFFWLPTFSPLLLLYWVINRPQSVQVGTAFTIGLALDIGTNSLWGLHALAYTLTVYIVMIRHHRMQNSSYSQQSLVVLLALLTIEAIRFGVQAALQHRAPNLLSFVAPIFGALIWPLFSKIMLNIRHWFSS